MEILREPLRKKENKIWSRKGESMWHIARPGALTMEEL